MPNRPQLYILLMLRNRGDNIFSKLPVEVIHTIARFSEDPNNNFAIALQHVADGKLKETQAILEKTPQLIFLRDTVITSAGLKVVNTTLLECALGGGDAEMIEMILPFFNRISTHEWGEKAKWGQLERYRFAIENMMKQAPYSLEWLMKIIKESSHQDITAELEKNEQHTSELRTALIKFRKDVKPSVVTEPRMHFNYQNLLHAIAIHDREWDNLGESKRYNDKLDRFMFARELYKAKREPVERLLKFLYYDSKEKDQSFLETMSDDSLSDLGFDYAIGPRGFISHTSTICSWISDLREIWEARALRLQQLYENAPSLKNYPRKKAKC
jgi:hypothetical protein